MKKATVVLLSPSDFITVNSKTMSEQFGVCYYVYREEEVLWLMEKYHEYLSSHPQETATTKLPGINPDEVIPPNPQMIKGIDDLEAENAQLKEEVERLRVRLAYWQNECEFLTQQSKSTNS